jgi:Holliday junction DNA helicase RuvA
MLSKAQGLGKKTAERIVVELKDKVLPKGTTIASPAVSAPSSTSLDNETTLSHDLGIYGDAVSALLTLGYKATDADQAVRRAADGLGKDCTTEELIRKALGR